VLLGVGGVGTVMLFGALALTAGRQVETRPTQTEPANKLYTRDEFRQLLMGKTMEEVLKAIGKPNSTAESPPDTYWYYRGITYDPVTGKTDGSVQVCIERGVVRRVNN
jgi:outer membrane protein assembly factor BamE (lipoprotein component of BamABCDE complex)